MDYFKSPRSGPRETPLGSGIHHKASRENDVQGNVMIRIGVGQETCIRDKDMDPKITQLSELNMSGREAAFNVLV